MPDGNEYFFQRLIEHAPVGVFRTDQEGRYTYVSLRWSEITGVFAANASGDGWTRGLHFGDRERVGREWLDAVRTKNPFQSHHRFQKADGSVASVWGQAVFVRGASETEQGFVGSVTDISRVGARALSEQPDMEMERLRSLAEAAIVFAHEVANPLNGISTMVQMLMRSEECLSTSARASLNDVLSEMDRLSELLRDFREFARPQPLSLHAVDLPGLVREVLLTQASHYETRNISVEVSFDLEPVFFMADRHKMKQVFLNLFNNAAEAMSRGGRLVIRGYRMGHSFIVEIADTGIGIPDGARVFDAFQTTKPHGTGLGLPLVKKFVTAHGGSIAYKSVPGVETVFTLSFPFNAG